MARMSLHNLENGEVHIALDASVTGYRVTFQAVEGGRGGVIF